VRSSAILDHAKSAMHTRAMHLYYTKMNAPIPLEYAPIAKAFTHEKLDERKAGKEVRNSLTYLHTNASLHTNAHDNTMQKSNYNNLDWQSVCI